MHQPLQYLALQEVPGILEQRGARRVSTPTVYRWVHKGVRGTKLRTIRIGAAIYSTREWLEQFIAAVTAAAERNSFGTQSVEPRCQATHAADEEFLTREGM